MLETEDDPFFLEYIIGLKLTIGPDNLLYQFSFDFISIKINLMQFCNRKKFWRSIVQQSKYT